MNSKIINPSQYKKITKEKREKNKKNAYKKIKKGKISNEDENINFLNLRTTNITKQKRAISGIIAIIIMILVSISSAAIFNLENSPIINVFTDIKNNNVNQDIDLKIACNNIDYNKNIILNELKTLGYRSILFYDTQYNITYDLAESVIKENDLTYKIRFKEKDINILVKKQIEEILLNSKNIYYSALNKISNIILEDKYNLIITLSESNPYFIYYLDFPLEQNNLNNNYNFVYNNENPIITLKRNNKNILDKISIHNYIDKINLIEDFKNNKVDMFFTTDEDDMKLIVRTDYNLKKYRDGETYFIFGNPKSEFFSNIEIRKAIVYGLDRNKMSKAISTSFCEVIDLPYIYSDINYKYDIYAAENVLIANGWTKKSGVYSKLNDRGDILKLELKLVVNSEDKIRLILADNIKEMLESVGIKVNIVKLNSESIQDAIKNNDYDICLAKVYLGKTPDISYLYEYIGINEKINEAIQKIETSDILSIQKNIENLETILHEEIGCIGLVCKNTNVIINKNIVGIENIDYMKIFGNIQNIGISFE